MKKVLIILTLVFFYLSSFSQEMGTYKDERDGRVYKTVKVGKQTFFAENFAYKPNTGNFWAYENSTGYSMIYGYLYDLKTAKELAPSGWHVPTIEEWLSFHEFLGGDDKKVYLSIMQGGNSNFNALLGGNTNTNGDFQNIGVIATFWSSTIIEDDKAYNFYCGPLIEKAKKNVCQRNCGLSVRYIKDKL